MRTIAALVFVMLAGAGAVRAQTQTLWPLGGIVRGVAPATFTAFTALDYQGQPITVYFDKPSGVLTACTPHPPAAIAINPAFFSDQTCIEYQYSADYWDLAPAFVVGDSLVVVFYNHTTGRTCFARYTELSNRYPAFAIARSYEFVQYSPGVQAISGQAIDVVTVRLTYAWPGLVMAVPYVVPPLPPAPACPGPCQ